MTASLASAALVTPTVAIVPVGLRVEGRRILVVGAGRIGARKAAVYVEQGAEVIVVAPEQGPEMAELPVAKRVCREFVAEDLDGVWLVVAATGDPEVDGAVFREAEQRRIWCNAADDPVHCSVVLPAVARRGDFTVSVSTGGRSPAVASWLCRRIEAILDNATLEVARISAQVRSEVRARGLSTEVPEWAGVLDDAHTIVAAGRAQEFETKLRAAVLDGRS